MTREGIRLITAGARATVVATEDLIATVAADAVAGGLSVAFQGSEPLYEVAFLADDVVVVTFPSARPGPPGSWRSAGPIGPFRGWSAMATPDGRGTRITLSLVSTSSTVLVTERPDGRLLVSGGTNVVPVPH